MTGRAEPPYDWGRISVPTWVPFPRNRGGEKVKLKMNYEPIYKNLETEYDADQISARAAAAY